MAVPFGSNFRPQIERNLSMTQNILLHVEDDPNDVLLLQRAFRKANAALAIHAVTDGDKAVAYLSGAEEFADREKYPLPSVVLLDLKMPRKSGLEVLQWIRADQALRRAIVIIFTSSKHDDDVNKAYEIGANSYLVKPVGFDMLVDLAKTIQQYWINTNERPQLG
jgi:CheY-like chemotaxis protein